MAFTGKATYDQINEIAEDVSDLIGMISPTETPLLDRLGDAMMPVTNTQHEWLEDSLAPTSVTNSTAIDSATADTSVQISGNGDRFQAGDIFRFTGADSLTYEEYLQIDTVVGANSLTFVRGFGGVGPSSMAAGGTLEPIANAALEGADAGDDHSGTRTRLVNYTQIFQAVVQVSGTRQAVQNLGGVASEVDYQTLQRTRELVVGLERAVILGAASNSLGSSTGYRTMNGIWRQISTNQQSASTLTESFLNNVVIKSAWDEGASDLDFVVADGVWKELLDGFAESRIQQEQDADRFRSVISRYEGSFANVDILPPDRWMPATTLMVLASGRLSVPNLAGRSFQMTELSKTGDSQKRQIIGEYTLEYKNEEGFARANQT